MSRRLLPLLAALALAAWGCKSGGAGNAKPTPPAAAADRSEPPKLDAPEVVAAESGATSSDGGEARPPSDGDPGDTWAGYAPQGWQSDESKKPHSIHLTWQRDPATTVTIQWSTAHTDLESYTPRVWAVPSSETEGGGAELAMPFEKIHVHEGEGENFKETLGPAASLSTYVSWTVELKGLEPDTEYTYRVGTWEDFDTEARRFEAPELSEPYTFRTGYPKGSRERFGFVMAGDSRGGTDKIRAHMPRLSKLDARIWFFNGDMTNYGTYKEWVDWLDAMAPVMRRRVLMPVQGNHEIFASIYYGLFALPREPDLDALYTEHAWAFDYANVHFVGLQSLNEAAAIAQVAWLDADLGAARADGDTDWIVVMFHHAAYSASSHGPTSYVRERWVPLFEKHGVDLAVAGHDHNYERTKPIRGGKVVEAGQGVVYVVAGAFYSPGYGNGNEWWTAVSHHGDKGNYVVIEVEAKTLSLIAYSGDGQEILDELNITK